MVSYGRYWTEALWARPRRVAEMRRHTHVEGLDLAIAARDAGTGMVFALPHLGNWEAAAPVAVLEGIPIVAVAEQLANQRITDWFTAMRSGFGIEIILATGSGDGTVALHLLPIDELRELARDRVTRTLTDVECRQYLHVEKCPAVA